ncbi:MAG: hypothetical protein ACKOJF_08470, partial [Planctomycetaceae bacterium]
MELDKLTFDQACQFIHKWFPLAERTFQRGNPDPEPIAEARRKATKLVRILTKLQGEHEQRKREIGPWVSPGLLQMLENPLLTTILCLVYDDNEALPENRADLYKKAIELMLKRKRPDGDEVQDEGVKKGRSKKAGHDAPTLRVPYHVDAATAALAEVAWWLQQKSQRVLGSIPALAKVAGEKLIARTEPDIERDGAKFLECMRSEVGLLAGGGGGKEAELGFIHRTFQEYLASV